MKPDAIVHRIVSIPSLERAHELLTRCRSLGEVGKIMILARAVASRERGTELGIEAAEIVIEAKAKIGEITKTMAKAPQRGPGTGKKKSGVPGRNTASKGQQLAEERISRKEAAECEAINAMPRADRKAHADASRKAGQAPTVSGAVALAKLPPAKRKEVLASLGDQPDVRKAIGAAKLAEKRELSEELRANPRVVDGRYRTIVIDPPWKYDVRADDASHRGKNPYPDMTVEEICALPVAKLAQSSSILWLWTTNAFMRQAFSCLDAWGFKEKTILTWDKMRPGLGDYLRNSTEHCILAIKGKPGIHLTNQTTMIREMRREHSRKPEAFYDLVDALCPGSKLEMFAREVREGFQAWGAETGKFPAKKKKRAG